MTAVVVTSSFDPKTLVVDVAAMVPDEEQTAVVVALSDLMEVSVTAHLLVHCYYECT